MMLMGAGYLPTAIGDEPEAEDLDTSRLWRRAMIGHSVSVVVPVVAANRVGVEGEMSFYGHNFITDERGDFVAGSAMAWKACLTQCSTSKIRKHRATFGFFRDRRPQLYGRIAEDI